MQCELGQKVAVWTFYSNRLLLLFPFSVGTVKCTWEKVRDKWQDIKSKTLTKNTKNSTGTGNTQLLELTEWEQKVLDFLKRKKSDLVAGLSTGMDSLDTDTQVS